MQFDLEQCCGCGACVNVCPTQAIRWEANEEGFWAPVLLQDRCVDCGLCRKVCPYEHNHVGVPAQPRIYAALHRDPQVVENSSSGGAFTALSDWILAQGGVVYGVRFDQDYQVVYDRAMTRSARDQFRGSKYVQCNGKDVFSQVEEDLKEGRTVLFSGTPCQVSGLKDYLTVKRVPQDSLYLVDNICHGGASPRVWQDYLTCIRSGLLKGRQLLRFHMRSKKTAWQKQEVDCVTDAGDESTLVNSTLSWNQLYLTTYLTRPSCFRCKFTSYDRVSDITLADYWNIENAGLDLDYSKGISLLLVNTPKGAAWLDGARSDLELRESDPKSCWQIHLERPLPYNGKRSAFWQAYQAEPMETIRKNGRGSRFRAFTFAISPILRKLGLYTLAVRVLSVLKSHGTK